MSGRFDLCLLLKSVAAATAGLLNLVSLAHAAADLELGRYLSNECMACHRPGTANATIPNIFGLEQATFAEVMKGYRDKRLANPVMQNIAGRLSDDDISSLALFFAGAKNN
jgi:cytochrome c553